MKTTGDLFRAILALVLVLSSSAFAEELQYQRVDPNRPLDVNQLYISHKWSLGSGKEGYLYHTAPLTPREGRGVVNAFYEVGRCQEMNVTEWQFPSGTLPDRVKEPVVERTTDRFEISEHRTDKAGVTTAKIRALRGEKKSLWLLLTCYPAKPR